MAAEKNSSKSALDRKKQALRDNLKRRKGALRGIASGNEVESAERPKARDAALKPQRTDPAIEDNPESGSGN